MTWKEEWDKLGPLTKKEYREIDWLYQEFDKTGCTCCPEYKLAEWKRHRLEELTYRLDKYGVT